jgi:beta-N-acetylglucosaminidase
MLIQTITKDYISIGQSTLYYQKYNVKVKNYSHQYMTNIRAANDEGNLMYETYVNSGLLDSNFDFEIPVYENMPTSACPRPST